MTDPTTSVLVVDDSPDLAAMLTTLIADEKDMQVAGTLSSADGLTQRLRELEPDVVLLDLTMPGRDAFDAMAEASQLVPQTRFIVLSGYDDPATVAQAVESGAWGFVSKHGDVLEFLTAIRAVAAGDHYLKSL